MQVKWTESLIWLFWPTGPLVKLAAKIKTPSSLHCFYLDSISKTSVQICFYLLDNAVCITLPSLIQRGQLNPQWPQSCYYRLILSLNYAQRRSYAALVGIGALERLQRPWAAAIHRAKSSSAVWLCEHKIWPKPGSAPQYVSIIIRTPTRWGWVASFALLRWCVAQRRWRLQRLVAAKAQSWAQVDHGGVFHWKWMRSIVFCCCIRHHTRLIFNSGAWGMQKDKLLFITGNILHFPVL